MVGEGPSKRAIVRRGNQPCAEVAGSLLAPLPLRHVIHIDRRALCQKGEVGSAKDDMLLRKTGNWGWSTLWNDLPSGPCQCTVDQFLFLCLRLLPTESPVSLLHPSLFGLNENGRKTKSKYRKAVVGFYIT